MRGAGAGVGAALYLAWSWGWVLAALLMFARGFLLARRSLDGASSCVPLEELSCGGYPVELNATLVGAPMCTENEKIAKIISNIDAPLVCGASKMKTILIVVDAFRYDFAEYIEGLEHPMHFQNKLPVIRDLLKQPERTRLYKFIADPPTTTLQRLKGLMTGSLPTFIDAGANFATAEIFEDNLLDQVVSGGGSAVLLGDDTWLRLFPGRWKRTHAQYSFHTWDLDTVDNEVDSCIYKELAAQDWDLLVAHYLGVDHAGHRYGPYHPEMTRKLTELDNRLRRITSSLPPDVVLYVIGDHGMTSTGDHGGESTEEITATLFVYSAGGLAWSVPAGTTVRQTELAATLAMVHGRPPPAPSLGAILHTALPAQHQKNWRRTLLALVGNLAQVVRYTESYAAVSQQLDSAKLQQIVSSHKLLHAKAMNVTSEAEFLEYAEQARLFVEGVRELCRAVWVEFDSLAMLRGCLIALMAVFLNYLVVDGLPPQRIPLIFRSTFVPCVYIALGISVGIAISLHWLDMVEDLEHAVLLGAGLASTLVLCVLVAQHWDGVADRWYAAADRAAPERLARAALIASAGALLSNSYIIEEAEVLSFLFMGVLATLAHAARSPRLALLLWAGAGAALVATRPLRACREEQGACWTSGGSEGQPERTAVLLAMLCLGVTVAAVRHWSGAFREMAWRYLPAVAAVCCCGHWAAGWGGPGSARRSRLLARASWGTLAVLLAMLLVKPGTPKQAMVRCSLMMYIGLTLALGAGAAPAAALMLLSAAFTLALVAAARKNMSNKHVLISCESSAAVLWALLAMYHFYSTGHHATLGHIRWAAAFHAGELATDTTLGLCLAAAFVLLNTFGAQLLFGVATPLLVLWRGWGDDEADPRPQMPAVFSACLKFGLCFAFRLLLCMMAATIHCRHLMVWSVFAPKLIFEAGSCAAAMLGSLLGYLLVLRTYNGPGYGPHVHTS